MGQIKQKFLEMEEKLSGSEPSPADDIVTDSEGNEYSVEVTSSLYGIDWRIYEYSLFNICNNLLTK